MQMRKLDQWMVGLMDECHRRRIHSSTHPLIHSSSSVWLPNMDLNHDKQIQSLLCYHYTIRHARSGNQSSHFSPPVKQMAHRMTVSDPIQNALILMFVPSRFTGHLPGSDGSVYGSDLNNHQ